MVGAVTRHWRAVRCVLRISCFGYGACASEEDCLTLVLAVADDPAGRHSRPGCLCADYLCCGSLSYVGVRVVDGGCVGGMLWM